MKDRIPTKPGRIRLVPSADGDELFVLSRDDVPSQVGTPLNKASLLSDATAAALGLSGDPTVSDALASIRSNFPLVRTGSGNPPSTNVSDGDLYLQDAADGRLVWIYEDGAWVLLARARLVQKAAVITESCRWKVPGDLRGSVQIRVFGGGAGGYTNRGGGGGEMNTWSGTLDADEYLITIGRGGTPGKAGGITSFGVLVSASGGSGQNGGSGGGVIGTPNTSAGGSGSYGGGGGGGFVSGENSPGGPGGTYGGGGGGYNGAGGSGKSGAWAGGSKNGTHGGGGGGYSAKGSSASAGGAGGAGADTTAVPGVEFYGTGLAGSAGTEGGGGGGGYGGNGGNGSDYSGGGGGGYGANGGNAEGNFGGGGGGWGGPGGNGSSYGPGGGGGYGLGGYGGDGGDDGRMAGGGGANGRGGDGVCIIYYTGIEVI